MSVRLCTNQDQRGASSWGKLKQQGPLPNSGGTGVAQEATAANPGHYIVQEHDA